MTTYGAQVRWITAGGWTAVEVRECASQEEAIKGAYTSAVRLGYRPPRWWEFRRRLTEINYRRVWHAELAGEST